MPRPASEYRALHAAADAVEPQLARAVGRAMRRIREGVSINALAMALAARDQKAAVALLVEAEMRAALGPAAAIVQAAVLRGGRVGAPAVNRARGAR